MKDLIIGLTAGMIAGIALATNPKAKKIMEKAKTKMKENCVLCECDEQDKKPIDCCECND